MLVIWILSVFFLAVWRNSAKATDLLTSYHQDDYNVKLGIVNVASYNHFYVKDPTLGLIFFNRTQKVINGSVHLLVDLSRNIKLHYQVYKLMSNEYRFFPLTVEVNVCDEYDRGTLGIKRLTNKVSNVRGCPLKRGFYYIRNAAYDNSQLPPYIPYGSYKAVMKFYHNEDFMAEVHCTATVEEKPMKWSN